MAPANPRAGRHLAAAVDDVSDADGGAQLGRLAGARVVLGAAVLGRIHAADAARAARRTGTAADPRAGVLRRGGRGRVVGATGAARGRCACRGRSLRPLVGTLGKWLAGRVRQGAGGPDASSAG